MAKPTFRPQAGVTHKRTVGPSFTTLVGRITHGEDPAVVGGPPTNRGARTHSRQDSLNGSMPLSAGLQVRQDPANTVTGLSATLTVSSNLFTGSNWQILLGDHRLQLHVDWAPGATAGDTAQAIVDAVIALGGSWSASRLGPVVTITNSGSMQDVRFSLTNQALPVLTLPAGTDLSFADANPDTITRNDGGDFVAEGYTPGMVITVANATNPANDGSFVIGAAGVAAGVLTLDLAETLTASVNDLTASTATAFLTALTAASPANGFMAAGSPSFQAPVVS